MEGMDILLFDSSLINHNVWKAMFDLYPQLGSPGPDSQTEISVQRSAPVASGKEANKEEN